MKIAVITLTRDDNAERVKQWKQFYEEYKEDVYLHVIVDNASQGSYYNMLAKEFPDSVIIRRTTNGGCTGAYNDGIKYCLENSDADSIAILANDIKLSKNGLRKLYETLFADERLFIIAPVLCHKGTEIIENFGHTLGTDLSMIASKPGEHLKNIKNKTEYTDLVNGGVTLAKAFFYRKYGLQDEKLFMYSDEVDTSLRVHKTGYKIGVTAEAVAWHCHVPLRAGKVRASYCNYLICRNKVYIAKKHFDAARAKQVYRLLMKANYKRIMIGAVKLDAALIKDAIYGIKGLHHGMRNDMKPNRYSKPD